MIILQLAISVLSGVNLASIWVTKLVISEIRTITDINTMTRWLEKEYTQTIWHRWKSYLKIREIQNKLVLVKAF